MAVKIGNLDISAFKVGSSDCKVYIGDTLLYPTTPPSFQGKWLATYSDSHTESAECDASSAITSTEIYNTNLVTVEIGDCVTSIDNSAFQSCSSLSSVTIPNSVTSIGINAFMSCTSLTSCTIGSGVTSIGDSTFYECTGLTSITINATVPPSVSWGTFDGSYPIYVPSESVEAYKTADVWKFVYASRIQAIPNS